MKSVFILMWYMIVFYALYKLHKAEAFNYVLQIEFYSYMNEFISMEGLS